MHVFVVTIIDDGQVLQVARHLYALGRTLCGLHWSKFKWGHKVAILPVARYLSWMSLIQLKTLTQVIFGLAFGFSPGGSSQLKLANRFTYKIISCYSYINWMDILKIGCVIHTLAFLFHMRQRETWLTDWWTCLSFLKRPTVTSHLWTTRLKWNL